MCWGFQLCSSAGCIRSSPCSSTVNFLLNRQLKSLNILCYCSITRDTPCAIDLARECLAWFLGLCVCDCLNWIAVKNWVGGWGERVKCTSVLFYVPNPCILGTRPVLPCTNGSCYKLELVRTKSVFVLPYSCYLSAVGCSQVEP